MGLQHSNIYSRQYFFILGSFQLQGSAVRIAHWVSPQCFAMCPWGWSIKALFRWHLHDLCEIYIHPIFGQTQSQKVSCTTESKPKLTRALDQLFFFPSYQSICLPKVLYVVGPFIFLFIKAVHLSKVLYTLVRCVSQYIYVDCPTKLIFLL